MPTGWSMRHSNPGGGQHGVQRHRIKAMALQGDGKLIIGSDASILYGSGRIALIGCWRTATWIELQSERAVRLLSSGG